MKRTKLLFLLAGLSVLLLLPLQAVGSSKDIKSLMGENFQNLHVILYNLISANYKELPGDAAIIEDHAIKLLQNLPESANTKDLQERFVTYANMLRMSSHHLNTVGSELVKRDQKQSEKGKLNIDYLRVVAAEHFGQMITTCVLCHNQFRRRAL
ncbi:MAG: hypothetical protein OEZ59_01040 [Deltaproteobacteria bacterium]|nr:hypothetical protein [Deltaproteobacteria bacterium]